jgi:hypothetical protein
VHEGPISEPPADPGAPAEPGKDLGSGERN